eukprot:jgi/Hompol1/4824/HPOL_003970-RA
MSADGLHGQKKTAFNPEALAAKVLRDKAKIQEYQLLCDNANDLRQRGVLTAESLQITTTILSQNPEFYTIWNFRREILQHMHKTMDNDAIQKSCEAELALVEKLLRGAPKSYWVWSHRCWILEYMPIPNWDRELKLVGYMLDLDARNFHGWGYRRFVVAAMKTRQPKDEFDFTTLKISQNFSNFSAWHYRGKTLPLAFPSNKERQETVMADFELVRNAIFTEPADQSAWFYQRLLLGQGGLFVCYQSKYPDTDRIYYQQRLCH